jgi:hypothetical protein
MVSVTLVKWCNNRFSNSGLVDKGYAPVELGHAIAKHVSSIEIGLLATDANIQQLDTLLRLGKQRWVDIGMTTEQPKWHLTFDGVLLRQVKRYWGLADKGDAPIELGHQVFGRLHERFRRASALKRREKFIMRAFKSSRMSESTQCNEQDENNPRRKRRRLRLVAEIDAKRIKREKALEELPTQKGRGVGRAVNLKRIIQHY